MKRIRAILTSPDFIAILILLVLWWLFFWRLFTPVVDDRTMLVQGDFSGQFVAFGAYQYERFIDGEIPLWNPYNNAGLPFIADTQAAVFYPPRLITIGLSNLSGGFTYNTLQLEMTFHVLLYTGLMYLLLRRMTLRHKASVLASFTASIIAGYGGFLTGYPPLQLALLEATIWIPLALLGIVEATRNTTINWRWCVVIGCGLGLSWMAGHPQTSWFATYLIIAYFAYRVYQNKYGWQSFIIGTVLFGVITFGIVAVQFIPSVEYSGLSMRDGLNFDDKGNGFPLQDLIQFLFPSIVSEYSPLYIGAIGLFLALIAILGKIRDYIFWSGVTIIGLLLSFGANTAVYHAIYNFVPGANLFRGQERAAILISLSLSILAGHGLIILLAQNTHETVKHLIRKVLIGLTAICTLATIIVVIGWLEDPPGYNAYMQPVIFTSLMIGAIWILLTYLHQSTKHTHLVGIFFVILLTFEIFSVTIDNVNFEPSTSNVLNPPQLVEQIMADQVDEEMPFRTDGNFVGLYGNYGSLYGVYDIRGISPLFIDGAHAIIQRELPSEVAWELFAVRYVLLGVDTLQGVEAENIGTEIYRDERIDLHRIDNPRPFAQLMTNYEVINSDEFARALLANPDFDERNTIILATEPASTITSTPTAELEGEVTVTDYQPESFLLQVNTPENALLSLSHVDYPGWHAKINGEQVDIIRAYGALTALEIPAGEHTVEVYFDPITYRLGSIISMITWAGVLLFGISTAIITVRKRNYADA